MRDAIALSRGDALALRLLRRMRRHRSYILCYHGLGHSDRARDPHLLQVPVATFRHQIGLLAAAGFAFVTVSEFAARIADPGPPPGLIALSFDDGWGNLAEVLPPVLSTYSAPATLFVTTGLIGKPNPWLPADGGALMLTEESLRRLAALGIELGAHTVTHPNLTKLDTVSVLTEMNESKRTLEGLFGGVVQTMAYPSCAYTETTTRCAESAGYTSAVTCSYQGSWRRYELRRVLVTRRDTGLTFAAKLTEIDRAVLSLEVARNVRSYTRPLRTRLRQAGSHAPAAGGGSDAPQARPRGEP